MGDLAKNFDKLLGEDEQSAKEKLRELGFKERQSAIANGEREEDIQAAFIRGMIEGQTAYEDIHFLASELNLEDENRFDVVGFKGNCLYLFELKNSRATKVFEQATPADSPLKLHLNAHKYQVTDDEMLKVIRNSE